MTRKNVELENSTFSQLWWNTKDDNKMEQFAHLYTSSYVETCYEEELKQRNTFIARCLNNILNIASDGFYSNETLCLNVLKFQSITYSPER